MDPLRTRLLCLALRFPRTRGDGPCPEAARVTGNKVSPHTRGWTPGMAGAPGPRGGFPAHAGMDPRYMESLASCTGFPRTRGDGPWYFKWPEDADMVSPHTRGWTPHADQAVERLRGFPAHAGMDPSPRRRSRPTKRFPRTRGDGPDTFTVLANTIRVSPHTRGWTCPDGHRRHGQRGFPAHAGMDHTPDSGLKATVGFPRTRGDGPAFNGIAIMNVVVSPHTRGWTPAEDDAGVGVKGFPAHAGMDPYRPPWRADRYRFPRTRGDGPRDNQCRDKRRTGFPAHAGMDLRQVVRTGGDDGFPRTRGDGPRVLVSRTPHVGVSPHTRGWTHVGQIGRWASDGFPAHAGMDPRLNTMQAELHGFPRTRGDGPAAQWLPVIDDMVSPHTRGWTRAIGRFGEKTGGFPAHAGMDPIPFRVLKTSCRFPRTRGDGPDVIYARIQGEMVSPHTRGWTLRAAALDKNNDGFPAHAGMDPLPCVSPGSPTRFPRTRGDGPSLYGKFGANPAVSPHTRGWTFRRLDLHDGFAGFPAHAGMDPGRRRYRVMVMWFPRTRGDGPRSDTLLVASATVSPHTRGWTLEQ